MPNPASQESSQQTVQGASAVVSSLHAGNSFPEPERFTRHLTSLVGKDKAFRVPATAKKPDGTEVKLEKRDNQADQGSEMNVISLGMTRHLSLVLHPLAEIGFQGLSMRTADSRDIVLEYWVWLVVGVEGIWRTIRCFVAPQVVSVTNEGRSQYLGLILGIPWLYSVNATISIRLSTIYIGDPSVGEEVREVFGPEMVFCKDHNLLMYPKGCHPRIEEVFDSEEEDQSSDSSSSEDDIDDIDDPDQDFH